MVTGYVANVKTRTSTGDVVLTVEVLKEHMMEAFPLNLQPIIILTENEYAVMADAIYAAREENITGDTANG